jgi:membrane protein implicated in regulation of membrane protease activity
MEFLADLAPSGLFGWHPAVVWAVVGALLIVLEIAVPAVVPSFVLGPFGVAAFLASLAALLGANGGVQLVLFGAAGVVLVVPARRFLARRARHLGVRGVSAMPVGKLGVCTEAIGGKVDGGKVGANAPGTVLVDGVTWDAVATAGEAIPKGATIEVVAVEGTQLVVCAHAAPANDASED